jgi:hypothetical protein
MKRYAERAGSLFAAWLLAGAAPSIAGTDAEAPAAKPPGPPAAGWSVSSEIGYTGRSGFDGGGGSAGSLDATDARLGAVFRQRVSDWAAASAGVEWERFDFGIDGSAGLIPNSLQSFALVLGGEAALTRAVDLRFALSAGFAGDSGDLGGEDAKVSGLLLAGVKQTRSFTWLLGVTADPNRDLPVLPAVGFFWNINPSAALRVAVPVSEFRLALGERWSVSAVARIKGGSFRVAGDFGEPVGREELGGEWVTFRDLRAGVRLSYAAGKRVELFAEAGAAVWRQFRYEDADLTVEGDPAPYGSVGASFRF